MMDVVLYVAALVAFGALVGPFVSLIGFGGIWLIDRIGGRW